MAMDPKDIKQLHEAMTQQTDRLGYKLVQSIARIFGALAARNEETYWYGIVSTNGNGFVTLANTVGAVGQASITISQDADFVGTRILALGVTAAGVIMPPQTATGPSFSLSLRDGGSDRQLVNVPIHNEIMVGTGQRSVPFTKNRLFRRNSQITFDFVNLQAVATTVWMAIQGYKIYDKESLDLVTRR